MPRIKVSMNRSLRAGFTLVELLLVMVIVGILAGLAQPSLQRALMKARAADVVGDMNVVRVAVFNYLAEEGEWPADRGRGRIPRGLEDYLPEGFDFRSERYTMDYDNWAGRRGRRFRNTFDIGLTVVMNDSELGQEVVRMLGGNAWTNGRRRFTWVLD